MFRDELDMLECRLRELEHVVYRHVLVEAAVTHRGDPKPLYYAENRERFAAWADRIIYVKATGLPRGDDPWLVLHAQQDAALPALEAAGVADDDIVLIADVDEFPPASFPVPDPAVAFRMRLCMYAVDWEYPELHVCSVAARWDYVRRRSLSLVRDARGGFPVVTGGWHLTWLGGVDAQRAKLGVHCHTEMRPHEAERIASGRAYRGGEHQSGKVQMIPVDVDETWPRWIAERRCPDSWFRPR